MSSVDNSCDWELKFGRRGSLKSVLPLPGLTMKRRSFLAASLTAPFVCQAADDARLSRYLYVVCPGIRDYPEFGGAGILVFDIDDGHRFVRRITTTASGIAKPRNIKGVVANATTRKLH